MELREQVIVALDKVIAAGTIETAIEAAVTKCVTEIINTQMRQYSDFGKQLEEAVKRSLAIGGSLDLPAYNDMLLKIIRKQVATYTDTAVEQQVARNLETLLTPPPETIKLTELVEKYKEWAEERREEPGEITLIMEREGAFTYIHMDDEPDKGKYLCDIQIGLMDGAVYHLKLNGQDTKKDLFVSHFYSFEKLLFQMHVAGTKVIIDAEAGDIDTCYGHGD
jgi:hypothetical protein